MKGKKLKERFFSNSIKTGIQKLRDIDTLLRVMRAGMRN